MFSYRFLEPLTYLTKFNVDGEMLLSVVCHFFYFIFAVQKKLYDIC